MGKKSNDIFTPRKKSKDKKHKYGPYSSKHVREKERLKEKTQSRDKNWNIHPIIHNVTSNNIMYSSASLSSMNYSRTWNHCITIPEKSTQDTYKLHATGDADLNGRKYVALPASMVITPEVKRAYNIM